MTDAPMSLPEFTRRFGAADPETRRAFVADLWEALGWVTSIERTVVVAERSDPVAESRRLLVPAGPPPHDASDVDAWIVPDGSVPTDGEVPAIDAADIRDRALYGADRSATGRVFRRHFDRELAVDPPGNGPEPGRPAETAADSSSYLDPDRSSEGPDADRKPGEESGDGDASEEEGGASDRDAVIARRVAGALVLAAFVVASVGLAAGVGLLPPEVVPGDDTVATPTDAGDGGVGAVSNGSTSRYASLRPTCERPPRLVIKLQLDALGRNGELGDDAGIRTAYRFASPANKRATGPEASFVRLIKRQYAIMLRYDSVEYGPLRPAERGENGSRTRTQRVTLTDGNGTESAFLWSVTKQDDGRHDGCWMTSSVVAAPEDDPSLGVDRPGVRESDGPVRRVRG